LSVGGFGQFYGLRGVFRQQQQFRKVDLVIVVSFVVVVVVWFWLRLLAEGDLD
jgi:hypothetical protein